MIKEKADLNGRLGGDKRGRTAVVCLPERLSKQRKAPKSEDFESFGGDKRGRTAVVCLPERLSKQRKLRNPKISKLLVEISGIEPLTS